jgi:hypothetical protein
MPEDHEPHNLNKKEWHQCQWGKNTQNYHNHAGAHAGAECHDHHITIEYKVPVILLPCHVFRIPQNKGNSVFLDIMICILIWSGFDRACKRCVQG